MAPGLVVDAARHLDKRMEVPGTQVQSIAGAAEEEALLLPEAAGCVLPGVTPALGGGRAGRGGGDRVGRLAEPGEALSGRERRRRRKRRSDGVGEACEDFA